MPRRRQQADVLPLIDVDEAEVESSGVEVASVEVAPKVWGLVAAGCAVAVVLAVVLGSGARHHPPAASSSPTTTAPAVAISDMQTMRSIGWDGGGFALTITLGEDTGARNVAGVDFEGTAPASHSYLFEVGACPEASAIGAVKATANPRGEFGAALEVRLQSNALLWMRVVDDAGFGYAAARGRMYGPELEFVEPSANPCDAPPVPPDAVDAPKQLVARRAVMSPPHLYASVVSSADIAQRVEPVTSGTREILLARFEDDESGLVVDPAWMVIDRAPITTVLGTFATVTTPTASNIVRVFDAHTGALELTFSGDPGPVTCEEPGSPDVCGSANARPG